MKRQLTHISVIGLFLFLFLGQGWANNLPPEPNEDFLVSEDVNIITGFYTREYSLAQNGVVDYKTARQIVLSEYNEYWNSVVETREFPLFYWHDANQDGAFKMWVDRKVEGCSCDIIPYEIYDVNTNY